MPRPLFHVSAFKTTSPCCLFFVCRVVSSFLFLDIAAPSSACCMAGSARFCNAEFPARKLMTDCMRCVFSCFSRSLSCSRAVIQDYSCRTKSTNPDRRRCTGSSSFSATDCSDRVFSSSDSESNSGHLRFPRLLPASITLASSFCRTMTRGRPRTGLVPIRQLIQELQFKFLDTMQSLHRRPRISLRPPSSCTGDSIDLASQRMLACSHFRHLLQL